MRILGITMLLLISAAAPAAVYKHVDANGRVTYSDVPPSAQKNVERVETHPERNRMAPVTAPTPSPESYAPSSASQARSSLVVPSGVYRPDELGKLAGLTICIDQQMPRASDEEKTAALVKLGRSAGLTVSEAKVMRSHAFYKANRDKLSDDERAIVGFGAIAGGLDCQLNR